MSALPAAIARTPPTHTSAARVFQGTGSTHIAARGRRSCLRGAAHARRLRDKTSSRLVSCCSQRSRHSRAALPHCAFPKGTASSHGPDRPSPRSQHPQASSAAPSGRKRCRRRRLHGVAHELACLPLSVLPGARMNTRSFLYPVRTATSHACARAGAAAERPPWAAARRRHTMPLGPRRRPPIRPRCVAAASRKERCVRHVVQDRMSAAVTGSPKFAARWCLWRRHEETSIPCPTSVFGR